jgi:hypothetical protein
MNDFRKMLSLATAAVALGGFGQASAQAVPQPVDRDSDGLIEINSLDDLNEIRNDVTGRTLRGSSVGCPVLGCFGYELTRDLDFDTNGNGSLDSGDWNLGRAWTPIKGPQVDVVEHRFRAHFNGNGHAIRHLLLRRITNVLDYGLFGAIHGADIRSLRLPDVDANVFGANVFHVGAVAGRAFERSAITAVTVDGDLISESTGSLGGVLGSAIDSTLTSCAFSGEVAHINPSQNTNPGVAGLVGIAERSLIHYSNARGVVSGAYVAGLVEQLVVSGIQNSFTNVELRSSVYAGGLVNRARFKKTDVPADIVNNPDYYTVKNTYALGSIATASDSGAGLVTIITLQNDAQLTIEDSYSNNLITNTIDGSHRANFYHHSAGSGSVLFKHVRWVKDPAGTILPSDSLLFNEATLLADMRCATPDINNGCAAPLVFKNWDPSIWDFGTSAELPAIRAPMEYPWLSADSPNATGDHESMSALRAKFPDDSCDAPLLLYAKEKNSGYVFSAPAGDEVLEKFSATQGLVCKNAQQGDGMCRDYSVRYLCDETPAFGTVRWTHYASNDNPASGDGDDETRPNVQICGAGGPVGIESLGDSQVFRRGPPRKLSTFSATKGLKCLNSDGTCKDYQVRLVCLVTGDR